MNSGLGILDLQARTIPHPFCELNREQFPKKAADADARVEIPFPSDGVFFLFIISINRTIKGQFHEAGKREHPLDSYLSADFFEEFAQRGMSGADLAIKRRIRSKRLYGEDRRILQLDVRAKGF